MPPGCGLLGPVAVAIELIELKELTDLRVIRRHEQPALAERSLVPGGSTRRVTELRWCVRVEGERQERPRGLARVENGTGGAAGSAILPPHPRDSLAWTH